MKKSLVCLQTPFCALSKYLFASESIPQTLLFQVSSLSPYFAKPLPVAAEGK